MDFSENKLETYLKDKVTSTIDRLAGPYLGAYLKATRPPTPIEVILGDLNIKNVPHIYVQKALNVSFPVYVITYDSRHRNRTLSMQRISNTKTSKILRVTKNLPKSLETINAKLTTPVKIDTNSKKRFPTGALIIVRDICGEDFTGKVYEQTLYFSKYKKI